MSPSPRDRRRRDSLVHQSKSTGDAINVAQRVRQARAELQTPAPGILSRALVLEN
jgi:hypothetical protein